MAIYRVLIPGLAHKDIIGDMVDIEGEKMEIGADRILYIQDGSSKTLCAIPKWDLVWVKDETRIGPGQPVRKAPAKE